MMRHKPRTDAARKAVKSMAAASAPLVQMDEAVSTAAMLTAAMGLGAGARPMTAPDAALADGGANAMPFAEQHASRHVEPMAVDAVAEQAAAAPDLAVSDMSQPDMSQPEQTDDTGLTGAVTMASDREAIAEPMEQTPPMEQQTDIASAASDGAAAETAAEPLTATMEFSTAMNDSTTAIEDATNTLIATAQDGVPPTGESVTAAELVSALPSPPTPFPSLQGMKKMMKSTEDFVAFGQANMEAFLKSSQIWATGMQDLTKQIASTAKTSFEESVSTFKAMSTAKSVKEAMDLQSSFAKTTLEKAMAESNKITDASIKLTEQTLAPITARVTVAMEKFSKAA